MRRRHYLATLVPVTGALAGCRVLGFGRGEGRDRWSVAVESAAVDSLGFRAEVGRANATTHQPPTVELTFENTSDVEVRLEEIDTPYHSAINPQTPGLILVPVDHQDPQRESRECWKPVSIAGGDGGLSAWTVAAGESWSITHEVWVDKEADCVPAGTFTFDGGVWKTDIKEYLDWSLTLRTQPVERGQS